MRDTATGEELCIIWVKQKYVNVRNKGWPWISLPFPVQQFFETGQSLELTSNHDTFQSTH